MWGKHQRWRQARREGKEGEGSGLWEEGVAEKNLVIGCWASRYGAMPLMFQE